MTGKKRAVANKKASRKKPASKKLMPQQEAKSDSTSPKRLGELAEQSAALARLVARNPSAPGSLLQKLGSHSDATVRKWVTLHPDTPPEVLAKLATQFPEQLLDNPVFDVLLLENPNLLNELPVGWRRSLLKREKCPVSFLEWLAQDDDEGVQLALAMNPNTPAHILEKMSQSDSSTVSNAARCHIRYPGISAAGQEDLDEALEVALSNEFLSRKELNRARLLPAWLVAHGPPESGFIPSLARWAELQIWRAVIKNNCVPDVACLQLAEDQDRDIRQAIAEKPHAPGSALEVLSEDPSLAIRRAVARNEGTPAGVLRSLAASRSGAIREAVASNRTTPPSVLEDLGEDRREFVRLNVAGNPRTPIDMLRSFATQDEKQYGCWLSSNPALPPDILAGLSRRGDESIKSSVASNPSAPQAVLEALMRIKKYRSDIAQNPSAPPAILRKLAADADRFVTYLVAENTATPVDVLASLSRSDDVETRMQVAKNPSTPRDTLRELAKDKEWDVRFCVAQNVNYGGELLEFQPDDEDHEEDDAAWGYPTLDLGFEPLKNRSLIAAIALNRSTSAAVRVAILMRNSWLFPHLEPDLAQQVVRIVGVPKGRRPAMRRQIARDFLAENSGSIQPNFKRLLSLLLPDCPIPVLAKAVRSTDWKERLTIAAHPNTPPAIRQRLADDGNTFVRTAARAARDTPPSAVKIKRG